MTDVTAFLAGVGVIAVFDPEGSGADFAYTTGMCEMVPFELHIWARPDQGEDPGADFILSPRDRHGILMRLGAKILQGEATIGYREHIALDGGHAGMNLEIGTPVAAETLDAYAVATGVQVAPIHWSLERDVAVVQTGDALQAAELATMMGRDLAVELGVDESVIERLGERFGPWTPMLAVLGEAALMAPAQALCQYAIDEALIGRYWAPARAPLLIGKLRGLARQVGRHTEADEIERYYSKAVDVMFQRRHDDIAGLWGQQAGVLATPVTAGLVAALTAWALSDVDSTYLTQAWAPLETMIRRHAVAQVFESAQPELAQQISQLTVTELDALETFYETRLYLERAYLRARGRVLGHGIAIPTVVEDATRATWPGAAALIDMTVITVVGKDALDKKTAKDLSDTGPVALITRTWPNV